MINISNYNKELYVNANRNNKRSNQWKISNYGLAIDKFGRLDGNKLDYMNVNKNALYHTFNPTHHKAILEHVSKKVKLIKQKLIKSNYSISQIEITQNWRLVLNLGASTAYNNGFLLHPIYGIPFLSDSAIKGMLRTYVIENYFDFNEEKAIKDKDFVLLFGHGNDEDNNISKKGLIIFNNAFPTNSNFKIEADIINNHNKDYYEDGNTNRYPKDTDSPNLINYITLKNATFSPYFYISKKHKASKINDNSKITSVKGKIILEAIEILLLEAFKIKGIGAKTNLAYGRLKETEQAKKEREEKKVIQNELSNGFRTFIGTTSTYGELLSKMEQFFETEKVLSEEEKVILLLKLDAIYQSVIGKGKQKKIDALFKQSRLDNLIKWIGKEKATKWFNSKQQ